VPRFALRPAGGFSGITESAGEHVMKFAPTLFRD
jgi:hypothetical protein